MRVILRVLHRAGEGAPYTGIKPAGLDHGPAIPAGDKALATGSVEPVVDLLAARIRGGIHPRGRARLYPALRMLHVPAREGLTPVNARSAAECPMQVMCAVHDKETRR
jgi:hypothetical protein